VESAFQYLKNNQLLVKASLMTLVALASLELLVSITCIVDRFLRKIVVYDATDNFICTFLRQFVWT
jgi:hypothetical protein